MKDEIKKIVDLAVRNLKLGDFNMSEIIVVIPENKKHGEYATNAPFVMASKLKKDVREIAEVLKNEIEKARDPRIEKVEALGFINFHLTKDFFVDEVKKIDKNYGKAEGSEHGRRIILDYTDPNPFKEFHIGHLMNNAIGESLSRIFEFQGAKVKRVCYQGDVGIHVAKAIWGVLNMRSSREKTFCPDLIKDWAMGYAFGAQMYEEDENDKKEIIELNKKIYNRSDKNINRLYDEGKKVSLKHFDEIYKKLGTKFDYLIFESEVGPVGKKIVEKNLGKVFEKGEKGAVIFKGEKYGFHTRVFINSEGLPTYEAKDLGLAEIKYKKYAYDQSFIITGNEVNEYFKVMLCAMDKINPDLAKKTKHIGHGMMRLPEGKMSSRTGNVITGESLIERVEQLVKEKLKDRDLSEKEKIEIAEKVAVGALKYSILKQSIGSDIIYDFDKSISFEGDSGPYLQYSYTRAQSVLRKAKDEGVKASFKKVPNEITQLEKTMSYFPDAIKKATDHYQAHYVSLYLMELASEFNNYYTKNKIVDKKAEFSPYKVALTNAFAQIMKNGLWMLGIETLEKM
jgi:arginyl-tRNA synthetase